MRLALYWSRWNLWTVIAPDRFRRPDGGLRITMMEAVMANEFGRLGDVSISTKPPLRLVLEASTDKPRKLSAEGLAEFVIGSARVYCGDVELTDPRDRHRLRIGAEDSQIAAKGDGTIDYFISVLEDISEQKRAEIALRSPPIARARNHSAVLGRGLTS